jgi:serine/threonine protein kinase
LLAEAALITTETAQEARARDSLRERLRQRSHIDALGRFYARLAEMEDISELAPVLQEEIAVLQLDTLHVLLFDAEDSGWSQLVYSSVNNGFVGRRVPSLRVLPEEVVEASGPEPFFVLPLGADGSLGRLVAQARLDQVRLLHNFAGALTSVLGRLMRRRRLSRIPLSSTSSENQIGRYRILRPLGKGGMARVYLADMEMLPGIVRQVALKIIDPSVLGSEDWQSQLAEEVRAAALIRHPNVVPVLEVGREAGNLFMVMEYVEGDNLATLAGAARAAKEGVPLPIIGRVLSEVLAGLHAAHEATDRDGIPMHLVHRDFSPQNILVGVDGITRLTDFGIAKTADTPSTTEVGVLKGKVRYMSPEQVLGRPIDRRTDIWAAGVVAWELVAGRRLHQEQSDTVVLQKVVTDFPRELKMVRPDVPPNVADVVHRALALEPDRRYATAAEFRAQLAETWQAHCGLADNDEVGSWVRLHMSGLHISDGTVTIPTFAMPTRSRS